MSRMVGFLFALVATASIALGSPLCCLLDTCCCTAKQATGAPVETSGGCPRCRRETPAKPANVSDLGSHGKPAPKPCPREAGCTCKTDVASHARAAAGHAPFVAIVDTAPVVLPALAASLASADVYRALPRFPARTSHPLLL